MKNEPESCSRKHTFGIVNDLPYTRDGRRKSLIIQDEDMHAMQSCGQVRPLNKNMRSIHRNPSRSVGSFHSAEDVEASTSVVILGHCSNTSLSLAPRKCFHAGPISSGRASGSA
jgi:hypothetical protein